MYYISSRHLRQGHGDETSSDEDEPPAAIANADEGADADMSDDEVSHQGSMLATVWSVGAMACLRNVPEDHCWEAVPRVAGQHTGIEWMTVGVVVASALRGPPPICQ